MSAKLSPNCRQGGKRWSERLDSNQRPLTPQNSPASNIKQFQAEALGRFTSRFLSVHINLSQSVASSPHPLKGGRG